MKKNKSFLIYLFLFLGVVFSSIIWTISPKVKMAEKSTQTHVSTRFNLSIFTPGFAFGQTSEEVLSEIQRLPLTERTVILEATEANIQEFHYGRIKFDEPTSKILKEKLSSTPDQGFIVQFDNQTVVTGSVTNMVFSQIPNHHSIEPLDHLNDEDTFFIVIQGPKFEIFYNSPEIKMLQDYFFNLGKATESWREQRN